MCTPSFSKRSLADVISNVLNQVLNAINEASLRDDALCLLLLKLKADNQENHSSDQEIENVVSETKGGVTNQCVWQKTFEQLGHLCWQLRKNIHSVSTSPYNLQPFQIARHCSAYLKRNVRCQEYATWSILSTTRRAYLRRTAILALNECIVTITKSNN